MSGGTSLYVHIPFCRTRCGYCTFASGLYDADLADAYLNAVAIELARSGVFVDRTPQTVFIGGGTPSSLSPSQLAKLLHMLPLHGEVTVEVNPESADSEKLSILKDHGVNRCSIGVQTFDPEGLRLLQRCHTKTTALEAIESAMAIGFKAINVDLMNGWPGQDVATIEKDMSFLENLKIQHISNYSLIVDPDAPRAAVFSELLGLEDNVEYRDRLFWDRIEEILENYGFDHYETSNYARPGFVCRHNVLTWQGEEYLGVGAAAHSHIGGRRFANTADPAEYVKKVLSGMSPEVFSEQLFGKEKARECAVFWLRLLEGIELQEFYKKTGYHFDRLYADVMPWLMEQGFLEYDGTGKYIRVAKRHHAVLDAVLVYLV